MNEKDLLAGISKEHLLKSIETISKEGFPPHRRSNSYDLVHDGMTYPPKYVLSLAGYFRDQKFIRHKEFKGGEKSVAFAHLKGLGFTILPKAETTSLKKARENPDVKGKYIVDDDEPEFFDQVDLDHLIKFKGQKMDKGNSEMVKTYSHLKSTYEKVEYWGQQVLERTFPKVGEMHIIKKPTNQGNKFDDYHWCKLYPSKELLDQKTLAFTLTFSALREDFCVKVDTVGLNENDPIRKLYLDYRGEFESSDIVKNFAPEEILSEGWEELITKSSDTIKALEGDYHNLLKILANAGNTEEEFISVLKSFPIGHVKFYFEILDNLLGELRIAKGDERVVFSCKRKRLVFKVGQRYAFVLRKKKEDVWYEVISAKKINSTSSQFDGTLEAYLSEVESFEEVRKNLDQIKQGCKNELERTSKSGFLGGNNPFFEKAVWDIGYRHDILNEGKEIESKFKSNDMEMTLNTILYGPPGTGKTYKLNQFKEDYFTDRGIARSSEELLKEKVSAYPFWKIFAAVLNARQKYCSVAEIMAHPIVKAKINDTAKTPQNTVWRILQSYADYESSQMNEKYRGPIQLFNKNANSEWGIIESKKPEINDIIDEELLRLAVNPVLQPAQSENIKKRYNFITFHQKYSYEDFIEGIKPLLKDTSLDKLEEEDTGSQLAFELKKGIFYTSCLEALKLAGYNSFEECFKDAKEERKAKFALAKGDSQKQFALFIDEINRANISAVFGELITLIEENKRLGQEEEMWLKLPYSNEDFAVPPNLYLIGSMNTADRSIALLDIALRRRFEFIGLYPDYKTIPKWAEMLKAVNDKIYELKKNPDFFIGHAFFINKEIGSKADIFNKKIIPLLMEYFQNNTTTVKSILTVAKVEIEEPSINNNYQLVAID